MKDIAYQQEAVEKLVNATMGLLGTEGDRHVLVFKAPTGSGKTVMATEMLRRLNDELQNDPDAPVTEVALIWVAPNRLHEQSYFKMKHAFSETRELHPMVYDDLDKSANGYIRPGQVLFVNWESINRENAVIVRETEWGTSLYNITRRTQQAGIPIIVIVDEEHMFGGRNAQRSEQVLMNICPKVEIRISATPLPETMARAKEFVNVERSKVIREEMIKESVILNPSLQFNETLGSLNQHLIHLALQKRDELAEAYRSLGVNINPLLLIQLPNDGEKMNAEDNSIKEEVLSYLESIKDISVANGKLAIWLSNEKTDNLATIDKEDDMTQVLLFKQAIALGWDCPRAAVLLIFRKIESFTFSAQTVGRILRMPEQHYYADDRLNHGYVYTNLSKDIIEIVRDDMDYLCDLRAVRRDELRNVSLVSSYCERVSALRNRLGSDFKDVLTETFTDNWLVKAREGSLFTMAQLLGLEEVEEDEEANRSQAAKNREAVADKIIFQVKQIGIDIVEDLKITGEVGQSMIRSKARYVRTMAELEATYNAFCARMLGNRFEKVSIRTLAVSLQEVLENLFELFESDAIRVVLYHANRPKFADIIEKALDRYTRILQQRQRSIREQGFTTYLWEVPAERYYKEETHVQRPEVKEHALLPYIELKNSSTPERAFTDFLEANSESIEWWYKNGDQGKQHYAVEYKNSRDERSLFYVDFVIRMRNGQIFLFDTKSVDSDPEAVNKHNALYDYMNSPENATKHLKGGVIIQQGENWKYSPMKIENTIDIVNWDSFYPDEYKS